MKVRKDEGDKNGGNVELMILNLILGMKGILQVSMWITTIFFSIDESETQFGLKALKSVEDRLPSHRRIKKKDGEESHC